MKINWIVASIALLCGFMEYNIYNNPLEFVGLVVTCYILIALVSSKLHKKNKSDNINTEAS